MPETLLTVIVSQGQSRNPEKRDLERLIAEQAAELVGVQVLVIPHLYDLSYESETFGKLRATTSDLVLLTWLYDRAGHWVLDRNGIQGRVGEVRLKPADYTPDDEEEDEDSDDAADEKDRVAQLHPRPERSVYCLDLRADESPAAFIAEIQRILTEVVKSKVASRPELKEWFSGEASLDALLRFINPTSSTAINPVQETSVASQGALYSLFGSGGITKVEEYPTRRWYPVIDFSRCTNCMECIDFCLFGVYGVDRAETILVEQPDNCRKGCPACSRVCPENAIIFPQHKTPAIAGAPVEVGGLKIDLSKLFGAPETNEDASVVAARERDEQLILAGREAIGSSTRTKARLSDEPQKPKDDLDSLIDQLDSLDL